MPKRVTCAIADLPKFAARREEGQALAEYGIIIVLIAVLCMAALVVIQLAISGLLNSVGAAF